MSGRNTKPLSSTMFNKSTPLQLKPEEPHIKCLALRSPKQIVLGKKRFCRSIEVLKEAPLPFPNINNPFCMNEMNGTPSGVDVSIAEGGGERKSSVPLNCLKVRTSWRHSAPVNGNLRGHPLLPSPSTGITVTYYSRHFRRPGALIFIRRGSNPGD
ncbi:hypothetical protein TNIN_111211 [Trichonephila inaurata madagascariensis]|uniref:Uncharacterized protein n=1 Tax=Trichonephila inaurata madagascariensis TaxID=2747483 RepID=A0A8X6XIU1_9ARAC|nr:hypothetical protein TNIN_111211 [Trichonephila inaurata madagascariensis]